jgi:predicted dehydrogenase
MMKGISRRTFMKRSVAVGAAAIATRPFARVLGANDNIRVAVVGFGGRGGGHIKAFHRAEGVRVVALCDVDDHVIADKVKDFEKRNEKVTVYHDYRKMMEDKSIDVVSTATPDQHHVPVAALAVVAGKDAYVEKPLSHTIAEGRLLVNLARKYNRIVQHGTQSRSAEGVRAGIEYVRSGQLGKCRLAKAINCQRRGPIGRKPDIPTPPHVHYDLWLGPAPKRPFNENRYHYNWHWWWDYGTGDTGNDGAHQIDIARWGLGGTLPKAVSCSGGQLWYDDDHETPDTQMATFEYDEGYVVFEMRLWTPYKQEGHDNGNIFYCDKGWVSIGRGGWKAYSRKGEEVAGGGKDEKSHFGNFLKAVRSRKVSDLTADVEEGHHSAVLCHLANISMRVGRKLQFDTNKQQFIGDAEANTYLTKNRRKGWELPTL